MKRSSLFFAIVILLTISTHFVKGATLNNNKWSIASPDKSLILTIKLDDSTGALSYEVVKINNNGTKQIIENSKMGIITNNYDFSKNLEFVDILEKKENALEKYSLHYGKQKDISVLYNEEKFLFKNKTENQLSLIVRVTNKYAAFRYRINSENVKDKLISETTTFNLPTEGTAWMHPYDTVTVWTPGYETNFENGISIGTPSPKGKNGWAFPLLFNVDTHWVYISESDVDENYCAMHIDENTVDGEYKLRLPEAEEANALFEQLPEFFTPWISPWRFIVISDSLNDIFITTVTTDLSKPENINDFSWVKPGKASWSWWSEHTSSKDFDILKAYIDFSVEIGWEYSLVDANWNIMKNGDLEKLSEYAKAKNIGLWVWYNSGGPHNVVTEQPRDIMYYPDQRKIELEKLSAMGIKGIKVDFFQSDKQTIIKQYLDILNDAEKYKIMVNFHGCTLPRGWNRQYPHLMTMEAVRGGEVYGFGSDFPEKAPVLNSIYPLTRNVAGPMDYTPVTFSHHKFPRKTSLTHELALSVVFESGVLHLADNYKVYRAQPEFVKEFLSNVPVIWDESKMLFGFPGKNIVVARRLKDVWYLAGINSLDEKLEIEIDLGFISNKISEIELITDCEKNEKFIKKDFLLNDNKLKISLNNFGGFVGVIKN